MKKSDAEQILRQQVIVAAQKYYAVKHQNSQEQFVPGDRIPYAGRIFDQQEITNLIDAALDFWLTAGKYAAQFEKELAEFLGVNYCSLVNSGSSANLLALMSLTSPLLGANRLQKGDEVITVAAAFPTTVTPILQAGAIPVFIDVTLPEYNLDCSQLQQALSDRTKAVMVAHTLGNPFNLEVVKTFCEQHRLWLIEDNCDALGSQYFFRGKWQYTGTIGDIGTSSFYPPHHLTMGEGGAVYTNDLRLYRIINSMRDWGRECWCRSGCDNTCQQRFSRQFGELPYGYDHKYVYSHFGYNLKLTDLQAAVGCAQLKKLPEFIRRRSANWQLLRDGLAELAEVFILPQATLNAIPSWFGFLLTVKEQAGFTRNELVQFLEAQGVQTRMLFAGNLIKHPCFDELRAGGEGYRVVGQLKNTDIIMDRTFWVGVYPGITAKMIAFMINKIKEFVRK